MSSYADYYHGHHLLAGMHELGIASSVLTAVEAEVARHPGSVPVKVGLRVGELAGVDPDALAFGFHALTRETPWERLALEIETCPRQQRCPSCGKVFRAVDYCYTCPACGNPRTECVGGEELDLAYVDLESL